MHCGFSCIAKVKKTWIYASLAFLISSCPTKLPSPIVSRESENGRRKMKPSWLSSISAVHKIQISSFFPSYFSVVLKMQRRGTDKTCRSSIKDIAASSAFWSPLLAAMGRVALLAPLAGRVHQWDLRQVSNAIRTTSCYKYSSCCFSRKDKYSSCISWRLRWQAVDRVGLSVQGWWLLRSATCSSSHILLANMVVGPELLVHTYMIQWYIM